MPKTNTKGQCPGQSSFVYNAKRSANIETESRMSGKTTLHGNLAALYVSQLYLSLGNDVALLCGSSVALYVSQLYLGSSMAATMRRLGSAFVDLMIE